MVLLETFGPAFVPQGGTSRRQEPNRVKLTGQSESVILLVSLCVRGVWYGVRYESEPVQPLHGPLSVRLPRLPDLRDLRNSTVSRLTTGMVIVGLVFHTAGLIYRWIETHRTGYGYVPLSNMYESLIFFSWAIVCPLPDSRVEVQAEDHRYLCHALCVPRHRPHIHHPWRQCEDQPPGPALQSNWLAIHVITCFLGYASFAVSFGISVLFLIQEGVSHQGGTPSKWLPSEAILDEINYKSIVIGFPMLTLGIVTGAAWANYAWGTYWSWDPKETWSLITWFVYAAFLHARFTRNWRGRRAAYLSILGFVFVLFTYFGVNYLISGLHSYA